MNKVLAIFVLVGIFVYAQEVYAAMSSTNYQIRWDTVNTGGSDSASSATYLLRDSVSGMADSTAASTSYQVLDGYRSGVIDQVISFDLYIQNTAEISEATNFSGNTISVSPTTNFVVGDFVALVQNRGANQVVGIGKLVSKTSSTLVVDYLANAGVAPVVDGSGDYVLPLTGSGLNFSTVDGLSVVTGVIGFEVTVDNESGYVIQLVEDGNLRSGSNDISDVSDGAVSVGVEEFGARSSDNTLTNSDFDTKDAAITSTAQDIVTKSQYVIGDRTFVTFKLSVQTATASSVYTNTLTFIASGNF